MSTGKVAEHAQPEELPSGARLASYTVRRCIGRGAMGEVYEAMHTGLDRRVAIKTLIDHSPVVTARFLREARAAARISHPNVVDVFDVGVEDGRPYLVMEYLEGEDMAAALAHGAALSARAAADLMLPLLGALQAAHEAGIVHRDLKPANIFLARTAASVRPVPKIVDFGISKLQEQDAAGLTATTDLLGTPYYMSPEQVGSTRTVDARSDLFSVGVILYQCVTGQMPFEGDTLYQVIGAILNTEPPDPDTLARHLPQGFAELIRQALEKRPEHRFQSARELAQALLPYASEPIQAAFAPELNGPQATGPGRTFSAWPDHGSGQAATAARSGVRRSRAIGRRWVWPVLATLAVLAAGGIWVQRRTAVDSRPPAPTTEETHATPVQPASATGAAGERPESPPPEADPGIGAAQSGVRAEPVLEDDEDEPNSEPEPRPTDRPTPDIRRRQAARPTAPQQEDLDQNAPRRNRGARRDLGQPTRPRGPRTFYDLPPEPNAPPEPPEPPPGEPLDPDLLLRDRK